MAATVNVAGKVPEVIAWTGACGRVPAVIPPPVGIDALVRLVPERIRVPSRKPVGIDHMDCCNEQRRIDDQVDHWQQIAKRMWALHN